MNAYTTDKIRNVVLLGHGGSRQDQPGRGDGLSCPVILRADWVSVSRGQCRQRLSIKKRVKRKSLQSPHPLIPIELGATQRSTSWIRRAILTLSARQRRQRQQRMRRVIVVTGKAGVEVGTEKAWELCEKVQAAENLLCIRDGLRITPATVQ